MAKNGEGLETHVMWLMSGGCKVDGGGGGGEGERERGAHLTNSCNKP